MAYPMLHQHYDVEHHGKLMAEDKRVIILVIFVV
jgi:hypothetical protein